MTLIQASWANDNTTFKPAQGRYRAVREASSGAKDPDMVRLTRH